MLTSSHQTCLCRQNYYRFGTIFIFSHQFLKLSISLTCYFQAVFDVNKGKELILIEIAPGFTVEDIKKATECDFVVSPNLIEIQQA